MKVVTKKLKNTQVSETFGPIPPAWSQETEEHRREVTTMTFHCYSSESTKSVFQVAYVSDEMESLYPLDSIPARRARRDVCLAALAKLKKDLPK